MKKDIFDRIMDTKLLSSLDPFYRKYKQPLLYLLFGGLCTVVNIVSFWLVAKAMPALSANVIAWIISVAFTFWTNRTWVFDHSQNIVNEAVRFVGGRIGTLIIEEVILWIGIDLLGIESMIVKIIGQIAVIIGNYVISKWFVFKE